MVTGVKLSSLFNDIPRIDLRKPYNVSVIAAQTILNGEPVGLVNGGSGMILARKVTQLPEESQNMINELLAKGAIKAYSGK